MDRKKTYEHTKVHLGPPTMIFFSGSLGFMGEGGNVCGTKATPPFLFFFFLRKQALKNEVMGKAHIL